MSRRGLSSTRCLSFFFFLNLYLQSETYKTSRKYLLNRLGCPFCLVHGYLLRVYSVPEFMLPTLHHIMSPGVMLTRVPRDPLSPHPRARPRERVNNLLPIPRRPWTVICFISYCRPFTSTKLPASVLHWNYLLTKHAAFCTTTLSGLSTNGLISWNREALSKMNVERLIYLISRLVFSHLEQFCFGQDTGYVWVLFTPTRACWVHGTVEETNTRKRLLPTTLSRLLKEKHASKRNTMLAWT